MNEACQNQHNCGISLRILDIQDGEKFAELIPTMLVIFIVGIVFSMVLAYLVDPTPRGN